MTKIQQAKTIAKKYQFVLPKRYDGYKFVWNSWHQPADRLIYPMTFDQYIDRIVEIGTRKPEHERVERFKLMKVSLIQPWTKADAVWAKADAVRTKAYAARIEADAAKIQAAHKRECPDCKWDGERLPQFD